MDRYHLGYGTEVRSIGLQQEPAVGVGAKQWRAILLKCDLVILGRIRPGDLAIQQEAVEHGIDW
ncbi:hypothetical protein D3C76_1546610 [compost metagenome]